MTVRSTRSLQKMSATATGPLLRSRAAQLADYLRKSIEQNKLAGPVPGIRQWSQQLGVSRRTLTAAIRELQREGWLIVERSGVRLPPGRGGERPRQGAVPRLVRLLFFGVYRPNLHSYLETISALQQALARRGIELRWETCSPARLREIARQPGSERELLVLASVPPVYQRLFAAGEKPVVVLGEVVPGVKFPFVNVDLAGAVRHATFRLLQHGCRHVVLAHIDVDAAGIRSAREAFRSAGAAWTRHPVVLREMPMALDVPSLLSATRRLAAGVRQRTGVIVLAPVPVSMVVTALWHEGIAVPRQAEVVALFHSAEGIRLYPLPPHYPHPVAKVVRHLTAATVEYFETGRRPDVKKTIPAEQARGG
jgi:DNA-binding LacI/PurR family transcriptional regulator